MPPFLLNWFDKEDKPAHPHALLITHVVLKGFQMGAVLGLVLTPAYHALRGKARGKDLLIRTMKSSMYGSAGFAALSGGLLAVKYRGFGPTKEHVDDAVMDRAFRLKFHQSQNRCDIYSIACEVGAGLAAVPLGLPVVPSLASGLAAGCLLHFVTSSFMVKNETWAQKKQAWKNTYQKMQ